FQKHRRLETLPHRIERRKADTEIRRQTGERHALDAALLQIAGKTGGGNMVVFEKGRVAVDLTAESFADNELGLGPFKFGVKGCTLTSLHAMIRPQGLLAIVHFDPVERLLARVL